MKKILIIDDDAELLELLKKRFEENKYDVCTASEGVEGLIKAKEEKPNVIILDVAMPVMDGYAFIQDFKREDAVKDIPVVILTAKDQLEELFNVEGIAHFMTKPIDSEDLLKKVNELA